MSDRTQKLGQPLIKLVTLVLSRRKSGQSIGFKAPAGREHCLVKSSAATSFNVPVPFCN